MAKTALEPCFKTYLVFVVRLLGGCKRDVIPVTDRLSSSIDLFCDRVTRRFCAEGRFDRHSGVLLRAAEENVNSTGRFRM